MAIALKIGNNVIIIIIITIIIIIIIAIIIIIIVIIINNITRLYEIQVADDDKINKFIVTPRQVQVNPLTDDPLNVNYLIYTPGQRLRIPLEYINHDMSNDLKRGCFVYRINRFLECYCDSPSIPSTLKVSLLSLSSSLLLLLSSLLLLMLSSILLSSRLI